MLDLFERMFFTIHPFFRNLELMQFIVLNRISLVLAWVYCCSVIRDAGPAEVSEVLICGQSAICCLPSAVRGLLPRTSSVSINGFVIRSSLIG